MDSKISGRESSRKESCVRELELKMEGDEDLPAAMLLLRCRVVLDASSIRHSASIHIIGLPGC